MYSDPVRCVYLKHLPDMRKPVQLSAACVMCELAGTCDPPARAGCWAEESWELHTCAASRASLTAAITPATDLYGGGDGGHDGGGGGGHHAGHPWGHHGGQGRGHGAGHQHSDRVWCLSADWVKVSLATFVLVLVWSLPWLPGTQSHGLWLMCSAFTCS